MELSYNGSGNVLYQGKEYRCDLYLKEDEGGILFKIYVDEPIASFIELPFEIDCLQGKLDNGFNFTAHGCYRTHMENKISEGRSVFTFQTHSMLKGVGFDNPNGIKLYKVEFGLRDVLQWGTISGYKIGKNYELSYVNTIKKQLYADSQIKINYLVSASMLPIVQEHLLKDQITLFQQGIIEIQSKTSERLDFFEEYYHKIKKLIEISTQKTISLGYVIGWSHSVCYENEEKHFETPITILTSELSPACNNEKDNSKIHSWEWYTLPELLNNNSFGLYIEKYDTLEPIVELYMEAFNPDGISQKRLFLNLVQALETYHSRFMTDDLSAYKKRIQNVILKNRPQQFVANDTAFLMANSKSFITLESRLADLLIANFEVHFDTGDIQRYDFPEVIASTRNYLIHYNEKIKQNKRVLTDDEISIYNKTLFIMLEYYLLRELGFTDIDSIMQKLTHRWGKTSTTLSIIRASKEKEKSHNSTVE